MHKQIGQLGSVFITIAGFSLVAVAFLTGATVVPTTQVVHAQACAVPPQVPNVKVTYPLQTGSQVSFVQAGCSWGSVSGASSYNVTVTQVDTNTVVLTQSEQAATLNVAFPVTQGDTYKCDVAAVNSCGNTGPAGSDTALCPVQGLVSTPSATPAPPTVLPKTGSDTTVLLFSFAGFGMMLFGAAAYFVSKRSA